VGTRFRDISPTSLSRFSRRSGAFVLLPESLTASPSRRYVAIVSPNVSSAFGFKPDDDRASGAPPVDEQVMVALAACLRRRRLLVYVHRLSKSARQLDRRHPRRVPQALTDGPPWGPAGWLNERHDALRLRHREQNQTRAPPLQSLRRKLRAAQRPGGIWPGLASNRYFFPGCAFELNMGNRPVATSQDGRLPGTQRAGTDPPGPQQPQ